MAEKGKENFKFCLFWTTNYYESSQYMGMDAVFVHLIDNYYAKGKAYWVDSLLIWKMKDRVEKLRHNLIGAKVKNLTMLDTNGQYHSLYNMDSKYTLVIFWSATCGHCKEEMPRVDSFYTKNWKQLGVQVIGVNTNVKELATWEQFITDQHLNAGWLHTYQTEAALNAEVNAGKATTIRQLYDVFKTPTFYLLDKDKKIIAKNLTVDQFHDFLQAQQKK